MSQKKYNVAIVGATGNVGKELLNILDERNFPVDNVYALASSKSKGREVSFGDRGTLVVEDLATFDFSKADIGLFSPGAAVSKIYAPKAAEDGCVVIDNTSQFRMAKDIPLIVPEVNSNDLKDYKKRNIIANPNCSTIQMVMALKPLQDLEKIKRVVVSTYQSVSGAGKEAMDELYNQTKASYVYEEMPAKKFTKRISFNAIPHIDVFMDDGYTKEEWKMMVETSKIMGEDVPVSATCVRLPIFVSHALSMNVEFEDKVELKEVMDAFKNFEGVQLLDKKEDGGYMTPFEAVGEDDVYISRIREDKSVPYGFNLWVVADNVRKGAALNTIQIAEKLIEMSLI